VPDTRSSDEAVSFKEFARLQGFKPSYVTALRQAGRLVLTPDGSRVLVAESRARIEETRDPSKAGVAARHAAAREAQVPSPPVGLDRDEDADEEAAGERPESPFQTNRAERERWLALSAKRDYEVSMGKLMLASEVESAVANAATSFRKAMERLPHLVAPQLAALNDEHAVRELLATEIEHALRDLAREFGDAAKVRSAP